MNLLKKKFPLFIIKNVYFCKINNTKVLVLCKKESNDSQYIIIPNFILYEKFDNFLVFSCSDVFTKEFDLFLNFFTLRLKCFEKNTRKKILLTGLGFRVNFSKDLKCLEFKIGLSHIVSLEIPVNDIVVFLVKNTIVVEGINPVLVGNFLKKIKNLKIPGAYTGKGFWYKNEIKTLKPVKKT